MNNRYAYITCITNDKYLPGIKGLYNSLMQVKTKYNLYVVMPETSSPKLVEMVETIGPTVFLLPNIQLPEEMNKSNHYWKDTFFKLQISHLLEFDKVIMLDSDMMIVKNIDHLFEKKCFTAASAGAFVNKWEGLNSGLMVLEPSNDLYTSLINNIPIVYENMYLKGKPCGDQDVYKETCKEWNKSDELHLSEGYNAFFNEVGILINNLFENGIDDLYVIHFYGKIKPWNYNFFRKTYYYLNSVIEDKGLVARFIHRYIALCK